MDRNYVDYDGGSEALPLSTYKSSLKMAAGIIAAVALVLGLLLGSAFGQGNQEGTTGNIGSSGPKTTFSSGGPIAVGGQHTGTNVCGCNSGAWGGTGEKL